MVRDMLSAGPDSVPVDQLTLRRYNLTTVLRSLREAGPRSRSRIAADTGLNKATVSSLVAELAERGLVRDGEVERAGAIGRPGQVVELDDRPCGLGVEVHVDGFTLVALDLYNEVRLNRRVGLDVAGLDVGTALDELAAAIDSAVASLRGAGHDVVGVTVALPGLVETTTGVLRHGFILNWREVAVVDELALRLGASDATIRIDNDANLCALAEHAMGAAAGTSDLVYVAGHAGVGAGVMIDGELLRGAAGYSGEVGHLPLGDPVLTCACGRPGCWETAVSLAALFREVSDHTDPVMDPSVDLATRLAEIRRRAELGDGRTLRGLEAIGTSLGLGSAVLVDLFNPRVVVLGGYFAELQEFLVEAMEAELDRRAVAPDRGGCRIEPSALGLTAACRGGAHVVLEALVADPTMAARTVEADVREPTGGVS